MGSLLPKTIIFSIAKQFIWTKNDRRKKMGGGASVALNNQASGREEYGLITPHKEKKAEEEEGKNVVLPTAAFGCYGSHNARRALVIPPLSPVR